FGVMMVAERSLAYALAQFAKVRDPKQDFEPRQGRNRNQQAGSERFPDLTPVAAFGGFRHCQQSFATEQRGNTLDKQYQSDEWRPRPELNWCKRFCRPLRNHSATWPHRGGSIQTINGLGNRPAYRSRDF